MAKNDPAEGKDSNAVETGEILRLIFVLENVVIVDQRAAPDGTLDR